MFDFFIRKFYVNSTQKTIDRLDPDVSIHVPPDLPFPSIGIVKRMAAVASKINALEAKIEKLTPQELRAKTDEFRKRYREAVDEKVKELKDAEQVFNSLAVHEDRTDAENNVNRVKTELKAVKQNALNAILPEAFAVVREASRRTIGLRHYDIQLVGGMVLHEGKISEMSTGEGKTLVCTLPAYLNALTGDGVHVVTVNDYLARRDREWMGPIFESLGLTVGVILHDLDHSARRSAYGCDITYGTNNEFGFDYLRDNMVGSREDMVQRGHNFAIVDEVDSILIDEARTPLIISGPAEESTDKYYRANTIALKLKGRRTTDAEESDAKFRNEDLSVGFDYVANEKSKNIALTEAGEEKVAQLFGVANIHDMDTIEYRHHILQAIKAKEFFKLDVDYVVRDGEVIIVDEFTGRMMPGRRWSDGLHQAVEAKEGIKIERENQTLATVTFQNYFRMYEKLAGMTGTANTEANEFKQIYNLDVVVLPTNRVMLRKNYADCVYKTRKEKYAAVVEEIAEYHGRGQPVLVGTISIEKSEILSSLLKQRGIPHQVLNAKYHELEAQIVAQAGRFKAVTIATNMAGRGTDIVLGGNAEFLAKALASQKIKDNKEETVTHEELTKKFLEQFRAQVKQEHEQVVGAGGLHVIGTERHESRRIDNQLRGRSGRQGDPGSSRFFVALEDDLMRLFASDRIMSIMDRLGMEEGQVIEHPWVSGAIEIAQKRVENFNFEIRKQLIEYDNVMNKQREAIYALRRAILDGHNLKERILKATEDAVYGALQQYLATVKDDSPRDVDAILMYLKAKFNYDAVSHRESIETMDLESLTDLIYDELIKIYEQREKMIGAETLRRLERIFLLNTIDAKWKDHLYAMDQLRDGVGLRSYGQRDPLMEYKREGFNMFQLMYGSIGDDIAEIMFKVEPVSMHRNEPRGVFESLPQKMEHKEFSGMSQVAQAAAAQKAAEAGAPVPPLREEPQQPIHHEGPKVGRNDPCPCGSGKKYKKCHGA